MAERGFMRDAIYNLKQKAVVSSRSISLSAAVPHMGRTPNYVYVYVRRNHSTSGHVHPHMRPYGRCKYRRCAIFATNKGGNVRP